MTMRFAKSLLLFCFTMWGTITSAQDIHFSMFDMAPLELNPAYTGFYEGTFRIGGIYRTQWQGMSINTGGLNTGKFSGFQTPSAYIDVPFGFPSPKVKKTGARMKNWAGVGISFFADQVGQLSNLAASLSLSYHIGFGQRGNTRLSLGVQGGIAQQRVKDPTQFRFEEGIIQGGGLGGQYVQVNDNALAQSSVAYPDFAGGLMLSHRSSRFGLEAGFSLNHFSQPKYNFLGGDFKESMEYVANLLVDIGLTDRFFLRPLVFYKNKSATQDLNMQLLLGLHFNDMKDITLFLGGGYRLFDAAIMRVGLDIKGLRFGFAYDLNTTGLSSKIYSNANRGMGFEVALSYIAKIYKNPVIKEILFCPRF